MLRILHAADAHLVSPFSLCDARRRAALSSALRASFAALCRTAEEERVDLLLLAGDVYEADYLTADDADMILSRLGSVPCPVVVAPGNHDPAVSGSLWLRGDLPQNLFVFREETVSKFSFDGLGADVYGYAMTGGAMERCPLDGFRIPDDGRIHLVCAHADLGASHSVYAPVTADAVCRTGAVYAALGHIHNPAEPYFAPHGKAAVAESGCLMGRAPDETGDKGALLVTIDGSAVQIEKKALGALAFRAIDVPLDGLSAVWQVEEAIRRAVESGNFTERDLVRVRLTGRVPPELPLHTESLGTGAGAVFAAEVVNDTTVELPADLADDPSVRGALYRRLAPAVGSADEAERRVAEKALRYALAALSGDSPAD